jgi:hypothetical protein
LTLRTFKINCCLLYAVIFVLVIVVIVVAVVSVVATAVAVAGWLAVTLIACYYYAYAAKNFSNLSIACSKSSSFAKYTILK